MAIDRNAGAHRGLHAPTNRVGMTPELRLAEQEVCERDNDSREQHRIGENAIHAAEEVARHCRRLKEIETAAFATNEIDERLIAIEADTVGQADHRRVV